MDADMQDPPALLPQMFAMLTSGEFDSVATRRVNREGEPPIRSWFARQFYRIINRISDADIVDGARDFEADEAGDGGRDRGDGENTTVFQGNLWMDWLPDILAAI